MPRERAKLTDKQERILVQAQLMGLTPSDMTKISNRLVALQKEADDMREIADTIEGYSWSKDEKNHWTIRTSDGYVCKFVKGKTGRSQYYDTSWDYNVTISKPGTAFKTRYLQKKTVSFKHDWRSKLCPEKSKELYGMIRFLKAHLNWLITK
jgi:hypothetical protein